MLNKKIASEIAIGFVLILAIAVGGIFWMQSRGDAEVPAQPIVKQEIQKPIEKNDAVCTQEAKQCEDGSYVGRTEPNCEFAACPIQKEENTSNIKYPEFVAGSNLDNFKKFSDIKEWKTYVSPDKQISFAYHPQWSINDKQWLSEGVIYVINSDIADGNIMTIEKIEDNAVTVAQRIKQDEEDVVFSEQQEHLGNSECTVVTTQEKYSIYCQKNGYYVNISMEMQNKALIDALLEYMMSTVRVN
jgi:hypothetical protein